MIVDEGPVAPEPSAHRRKHLLSLASALIVCVLFVAVAAPRPTAQRAASRLPVDQLMTPVRVPAIVVVGHPEPPTAACSGHWVFVWSGPVRLPAAHDVARAPVPLSTYIYDRTGDHLLYTLEDERRELVSLDQVLSPLTDQRLSPPPSAACVDDIGPRPETAPPPNVAR